MDRFVKELRKITGVSKAYAIAAWYCCSSTKYPEASARQYAYRFRLCAVPERV